MEHIENIKKIEDRQLEDFIKSCFEKMPDAKKVLVIFPDYTRVDFTDKIAPLIAERFLAINGCKIDFLNAGGTHRKMSEAEIAKKLGLSKKPENASYLNHDFDNRQSLKTIGRIEKNLVAKKTDGHLDSSIDITVNKLLFSDYDLIIALSATIPHEAAGYSGGLKIFFPGVSGPEVIDLFHWAAVLVGLGQIIGIENNNARDLINAGAKAIFDKIRAKIYSFNMVCSEDENGTAALGLYIGSGYEGFKDCYKKACSMSKKVHIKYIDRPLSLVVQQIPKNYDEIWTAAKGSYKLQKPGVLAPGAEVIIYAPQIKAFHSNARMEKELCDLGYHCRNYVCNMLDKGLDVSRNAAAHVINATGPGSYDPVSGKEEKSFKLTLATAIPESKCKALGLGYRDPKTLKKSDFIGDTKLWIEKGAKYLYELRK